MKIPVPTRKFWRDLKAHIPLMVGLYAVTALCWFTNWFQPRLSESYGGIVDLFWWMR